jgi:hypothetical protein
MRAAALEASVPGTVSTDAQSHGGPDVVEDALSNWRDGPAKKAILDFVAATNGQNGSEPVAPEERVAVFDNDGTLWCEKPVPIQMDFILRRFVEMAQADPALRETRRRPTTSTTDPRSRSASGAAPAVGRSSPPATRTATSRCSTSP